MQTFTIPTNLNGSELRAELNAAGVKISNGMDAVLVYENKLHLEISEKDKSNAERVVALHNGNTVAVEMSLSQKLTSLGISMDELKSEILT